MITVGRTTDKHLIRQCMTHPAVWSISVDDSAGPVDDFQPSIRPDIVYLAAFDDGRFLGCILYCRVNFVLWEAHVRLLPESYGEKATEIAKKSLKWMWEYGAWRIQSTIPSRNSKAIQFGLRSGMTIFGLNPGSWGKDGFLDDLVLMGISRPSEV